MENVSVVVTKNTYGLCVEVVKRHLAMYLDIYIFIAVLLYKCVIFNKLISLKYHYVLFFTASIGAILMLAGISLWFQRRTRIIVLLVFDVLVTAILIADVIFYSYFNDVISAPVLLQVALVDSLESSIMNLFRVIELLFVIDLAILIPVAVQVLRKNKVNAGPGMESRAPKAIAVILAAICLISFGFARISHITGRSVSRSILDHTLVVKYAGILNFHAGDTFFFVKNLIFGAQELPEAEKKELKTVFAETQPEDENKSFTGLGEGKNLIVIQMEALQALMINREVNGIEVTPNLNRFAKRSLHFTDYYTQVAAGGTSDAEFISNSSYYPLAEGAVYYQYAGNDYETLPKSLKKRGYNTIAMHAYRGSFWNREAVYPVIGFDEFISEEDLNIDETIAWGLSDHSFLKQAADRLEKLKNPFHSFIITLSSHYPYEAFQENMEFDAGEFNGTFFGNYAKAIHYADSALGQFIERLDKDGLMENSVVVLYGDHNGITKKELEEIREYLELGENEDLGLLEMRKVPLLIHLPGDKRAGLQEKVGGQVDLFPTVANIMGLEPQYCMGSDLLNGEPGFVLQRDGSVTDGKLVYIKRTDECYDMTTGEPVAREKVQPLIDKAEEELHISDVIIKNNLIPYFKKQK
jgi:lipoteichoic acid synthase